MRLLIWENASNFVEMHDDVLLLPPLLPPCSGCQYNAAAVSWKNVVREEAAESN